MIRLWSLGDSLIEIGKTRIGPDAEVLFATALVLVMERGHRVPRDRVTGLLWPDAEEAKGRHCLRQALYQLRRAGASIRVQSGALELPVSDVVADYEELTADGAVPDAIDVGRLGGGFLATYRPRLSAALAEWVEAQRAVVHASARRVLLRAIADRRGRSDWERVESLARACLVVDPLNEEATLALAESVALAGCKAEAVGILDRYLGEIGPDARDLKVPASVLRRRIAERLPQARYGAPPETALFGRGELMATLTAELRQARDGAGRGCLLVGAPGIGKSRLAAELGRVATLDGVQVERTVCHPGDAQRPLSAFVDLVPGLLMLPGAIGCSPTSMTYLRRLTEHDPDAPSLAEDEHDAAMRYSRLRRALFDLVDAVASEGSLMLVVENVQWLDPLSWSLFREMVEWVATRRVLFVFTSRAEGTAMREADPAPGLRALPVPPLESPGATALLEALAGARRDDLSPAAREWYLASAEGNPLYLRELVTHWLETGATYSAPTSLMDLIQQRLARLSTSARYVLQACAMLGKSCTFDRVERVLQYRSFELFQSAEELETAGFIVCDGIGLRCRHDLLADASSASMTEGTRKLLHRSIASALEVEAQTARTSTLIWFCAQQWRLSGERERALTLIHSCTTHLMSLGLCTEAAQLLEHAEELCGDKTELANVVLARRDVSLAIGDWLSVRTFARRVDEFPLVENTHERAQNALALIEADWRLHEPLQSLLERAVVATHDRSYGRSQRLSFARFGLIFADGLLDAKAAQALFDSISDILIREDANAISHWVGLIYHSSFGSLAHAEELATLLVQMERARGATPELITALRLTSIPLRRAGQYHRAIQQLREATGLADRLGYLTASISCQTYLISCYIELDDLANADQASRGISSYSRSFSDERVSDNEHLTRIMLTLAHEQYAEAWDYLQNLHGRLTRQPGPRDRLDGLSVQLHCSFAMGIGINPDEWTEFQQLYQKAREHGGQDYSTFVLCTILAGLSQRQDAAKFLYGYLRKFRRETAPIPTSLRNIASQLGVRLAD